MFCRNVVRAGIDLAVPLCCGGCDRPGIAWCPRCARTLEDSPVQVITRVPVPAPVWACGRYRGPARRAVLAAKDHGRTDLTAPLGESLAHALRTLARWGELPDAPFLQLVPAPTRATSARRRGGDTVTAMAQAAATALGPRVRVTPALFTAAWTADSAGLSAPERARNLSGRIRLRSDARLHPHALTVLVDDVITTGTTAAESARVLTTQGIHLDAVLVIAAA
ncbi:ComF family protein [Gordonia amarae]|uniref:ComF family protein n=1 Tax=Gordonia amarae TaxID=36821 RepID=A0A857LW08_9ACTN|nr:ComF family protein [Gordonia amarae]QHN20027.1 ComF family protein [Gordonia amarae]QHN24485.1 ComF family protein [Gordonia amarae]QHN33411.1 ComF family protein [Gordonia amarae]QHN42132.1 ComF family protein [Gordonia amarae]